MVEKTKSPAKAAVAAVKVTPPASKAKIPAAAKAKAKPVKMVLRAAPKAANITPDVPAVATVTVVAETKPEKHKKPKMIRDSFSMTEGEYSYIATIKARCLKSGVSAKKSEVLRAALKCLISLSDVELTKAITDLDFIKTGRPQKV